MRVATKFGLRIDEVSRTGAGTDVRPAAIRAERDASLERLGVEAIDLYRSTQAPSRRGRPRMR